MAKRCCVGRTWSLLLGPSSGVSLTFSAARNSATRSLPTSTHTSPTLPSVPLKAQLELSMAKLTKREIERAAAAAAAAGSTPLPAPPAGAASSVSASPSSTSQSYDHPPSSEEIASLFTDAAAFDVGSSCGGGSGASRTPAAAAAAAAAAGAITGVMKKEVVDEGGRMTTGQVMPAGNGERGGGGGKRSADEAFSAAATGGGGWGGDAMSVASSTTDGWDEASRSSTKSTTATAGGRPRKTPTRPSSSSSSSNSSTATPGSADKNLKGLRHFSLKVCRKVEEKGTTNYNEVADELVAEVLNSKCDPGTGSVPVEGYDEKNIRRRVYDALNVLMAMDIISKEKKEIRWRGLPSSLGEGGDGEGMGGRRRLGRGEPEEEMESLRREKRRVEAAVGKKKEVLQELIRQRVAFQKLVKRNGDREAELAATATSTAAAAAAANAVSSSRSSAGATAAAETAAAAAAEAAAAIENEEQRKIPLPFIIINTHMVTVIQCEMTEDRSDVFFNFSNQFELKDDNDILKRMRLQQASGEEVESFVPATVRKYVPESIYG